MFKEFKAFALKGNVLDMAVGVIIGGAFGKIVTSLVNDIIMPIIGLLIGGVNFSDLKIVIRPATDTAAEAAFMYGSFLQTVVDFLIIAISVFIFVKCITTVRDKVKVKVVKKDNGQDQPEPEPVKEEPQPTKEELLLTEIRDLLKSRQDAQQ